MLREIWEENVDIDTVTLLMKSYTPDYSDVIADSNWHDPDDEDTVSWAEESFCAALSGWITVPMTGEYRFCFTSDDYGRLYVSQDADMDHAQEVARVDGWAGDNQWDRYDSQVSDPMLLKEGQVMAVYATMQQGTGGYGLAIAWTGPDPSISNDVEEPTYITDWVLDVSPSHYIAHVPNPVDGQDDVALDSPFSWMPGADAIAHDVYFGVDYNDVSDATRETPLGVLLYQGLEVNTFDVSGQMTFDQVYYWRVDEIEEDGTVQPGKVWTVTAEPALVDVPGESIVATASHATPTSGPENTINGSGLDDDGGHSIQLSDMWQTTRVVGEAVWISYAFDMPYELSEMWVWNSNTDQEYRAGIGLKDVTIETSLDGETWSTLGDFVFEQGTSAPNYMANTIIDFGGLVAQYVRLNVNSGYGIFPFYGLSEVCFKSFPHRASHPVPDDGSLDRDAMLTLSWRSGRDAVEHQVYLSTDEQAVESGTAPVEILTDNQWSVPDLELESTYYWSVDEVDANATTWLGHTWSFSTQDSILIDDFDSYNDDYDNQNAVFQAWVDGYGSADNGSQIGHFPGPYSDWTVVRQGSQSMPFYYDSDSTKKDKSIATRTFDPPLDWTTHGETGLSFYFFGDEDNTTGDFYVIINDEKIPYPSNIDDLTQELWIQWVIAFDELTTDLSSVESISLSVENDGDGLLYIDDMRLYRNIPWQGKPEQWIEAEDADTFETPMQIYDDPNAWNGQYIATLNDGTNDPQVADEGGVAYYTLHLEAGTYRILARVLTPDGNSDSFWVRLQGATTDEANYWEDLDEDEDPGEGVLTDWILWSIGTYEEWTEVAVESWNNDGEVVLFEVDQAGIYNLEIKNREQAGQLDAIKITTQLGSD